jgi:16S rRNA (cytidine1402-2'-O)-methyltransferase
MDPEDDVDTSRIVVAPETLGARVRAGVGTLYLIATPIGNEEDITFRAVRILREADVVVCEERPVGERLLRRLGLPTQLETLNEHNEVEASEAVLRLLKGGKRVALISDGGTPVFSDPGRILVRQAAELRIPVVPLPGPSSLLPALTVSGFPIERFLYYGWLSPKRERRRAELRRLAREPLTLVLMETPYRLGVLLDDLAKAFGMRRQICIAFNLTMPDEQLYRGNPSELRERLSGRKMKGEFVVVIEGMARSR